MGLIYGFLFFALCATLKIAHGAECTPNDYAPCMSSFSKLASAGQSEGEVNAEDIQEKCGVVTEFLKCQQDLPCDLPEALKSSFDSPQLKEMQSFCAGADTSGSGSCSFMDIAKCQKLVESLSEAQSNLSLFCPKVKELKKCFADIKPHCTGEMMNMVNQTLETFIQQENSMCGGCDMVSCMSTMMNVEKSKDEPSVLCKSVAAAVGCFENILPKCSDEQKQKAEMVLKDLKPMSSEKCCQVLISVNEECIEGNEHLLNDTTFQAKDDECQKLETVFTCSQKYNPQCPKPIMEGMQSGKKVVRTNLEACEEKGYKVSVSYKDNNSGGVVFPTVAVLLSALLASLFKFDF